MDAVCVDGGMYLGARAFLAIQPDGQFLSFEKDVHDLAPSEEYLVRDLSKKLCMQ